MDIPEESAKKSLKYFRSNMREAINKIDKKEAAQVRRAA